MNKAAVKIQVEVDSASRNESNFLQVKTKVVIEQEIVFDFKLSIHALSTEGKVIKLADSADVKLIRWLPKGEYLFTAERENLALPDVENSLYVEIHYTSKSKKEIFRSNSNTLNYEIENDCYDYKMNWVDFGNGEVPIDKLSWNEGHENWFFRHFDHAAEVVTGYMLNDHPNLKGKILDVGCGDGITDLAIALRQNCELLVGIDPFAGYERLQEVMQENHLNFDIPKNLRFYPADGNHIPFADDTFDVVISWGSVEHIAGGYIQTLLEIKRVLKNGGLLFILPGLFYSNVGHHLGEFSDEPFFHLTKPESEVKKIVLENPINRMDRSGHEASREEYWQWYKELNPIKTADFEQQLKWLNFEIYRAALRPQDLVEFHHPELQRYSMIDLAMCEVYISAFNRKNPRPDDFEFIEI